MEFVIPNDSETNSALSNNDYQNKKKISVMDTNGFSTRKKSQGANSKHRPSTATDKRSSKAYSYKCGLDDAIPILKSPSNMIKARPSENIGVRSMSFDFPSSERIDYVEAVAFIEILREALNALDILRRTIKIDKTVTEHVTGRKIVRKRNSCAAENERKMFFGEDAGFVPVVQSVSEKISQDRDLVYNVFRKIIYDLERNGSYEWLRCEVNTIVDSVEKENNLEASLKIWSDLAKKLRASFEIFDKEFEDQKKEYIEEADKLAAQIDASYCANNEKLDYVSRMEASKLEQQNIRFSLEEEALLNEIKELEKTRKADAKVSEQLQSYLRLTIDDYEDQITAWKQRYNEELERRQQETTELQEKIDELKESLERSYDLRSKRQAFIDEFAEILEKERKEIEYWNEIHKAATLIQSIWRGYMVRHKLGPYAVLKLKKTKKKSKKSKKSKK